MLPARISVDRTLPSEAAIRHALEQHAEDAVGPAGELVRLHRILYPAFRVRHSYERSGRFPWSDATTDEDLTLLDGLWTGNHGHLQQYRSSTRSPTDVATDGYEFGESDAFGTTILLDFQVPTERAASLLPERFEDVRESKQFGDPSAVTASLCEDIGETFGLPDELDETAVAGIDDVDRVYLPFWVAEIDRSDERDVIGAVRDAGAVADLSDAHGWLSTFVREDASRLARYAHDAMHSSPDRTGTAGVLENDADDSVSDGSPSSRFVGATETRTGDEPVQPDDVDLDAETLVEPSPDRCFGDVGGMSGLEETLRRSVSNPSNGRRRTAPTASNPFPASCSTVHPAAARPTSPARSRGNSTTRSSRRRPRT